MHSITVRNVNEALREGVIWLCTAGRTASSRNGLVLESRVPVCVTTKCPEERVLFSEKRDANPFFHFMESLWMLGGRRDVAWISQYNARMSEFSDNGESLNGAYGHRWRSYHYGVDQLGELIQLLGRDPETRRAVLQMWSVRDLGLMSRDLPCNTQAFFSVREDALSMMVTARSNDAIWGAHGANAVHFSMLLEYLAFCIGFQVGDMQQLAYNYHVYTALEGYPNRYVSKEVAISEHMDLYAQQRVAASPIFTEDDTQTYWDDALRTFLRVPSALTGVWFFDCVAAPMHAAWVAYKNGDWEQAHKDIRSIEATDWQQACSLWVERREIKGKTHATTA